MARIAMTKKQKLEKIMNNFELFCRNFVKIVDNNGDLIPFELNDQQKEFINNAGKFNIILKPRQLGFTTVQLAYCLWMAIRNPNTNYLIMSYKGDSSKALLEKLKMMDKHLPREKYPHVFPETDRSNRDEIVFSNGSRIIPATSGTKDVGRGLNLMYILLSEYAFMDNQTQLLLSLEPALQKTERSRIVIETTANSFNDFQRLYDKAKKGNSKYKAFFFPFFSSAYEKQFAYDIQQAVKWYMATNKGKRLSKKDLTPEQKQLHDMGCSLNMLMWREWMLMDKDKNEFYQEYPASDIQAFISTGLSVFDQTKILEQMNYTLPPLDKRELEELPEVLRPYIGRGLEMYNLPKRGMRYFAGVDVSAGSKNDSSTIVVFGSDGEQYASFSRNDIPIYKFVQIVREIGLFFNYSFLVIERNGLGISLLERLRKDTDKPYLNLFKHKQFDKGKTRLQFGWLQTATTKNIAITDAKEQFECGLVNIHCKELLSQMQTYTEDNKRTDGHHHDLVQAFLLAVQGIKHNKYYVEVV